MEMNGNLRNSLSNVQREENVKNFWILLFTEITSKTCQRKQILVISSWSSHRAAAWVLHYLGQQKQGVAMLQLPVVRGKFRLGVGLLCDDALHVCCFTLGLSQIFLRSLDKILPNKKCSNIQFTVHKNVHLAFYSFIKVKTQTKSNQGNKSKSKSYSPGGCASSRPLSWWPPHSWPLSARSWSPCPDSRCEVDL